MLRKILLGSVAAVSMVTTANAFVIDTFSDAPMTNDLIGPEDAAAPDQVRTLLDNETSPGLGDGVAHGSIIGGYRDVETTLVEALNSSRHTRSAVDTMSTTFIHSQDIGVRSHTYITWDGLGSAGLASEDLTDGGISDVFHLVVLAADHDATWSLQVDDGDSSFTHVFVNIDPITVATDFYLPFALFTGIDMTDVRKIVFGANVNDTANLDSEVDFFGTTHIPDVPEPASMTLLGAGLMGLGYMGRRRKA